MATSEAVTLNPEAVKAVIALAKEKAAGTAWERVTKHAAAWLVTQSEVRVIREPGKALVAIIPSSQYATNGQRYYANGVCECHAYVKGLQCWHRAAARMIELALDHKPAPEPVVEQAVLPLADRLAARRKAFAEMDELFTR